MTLAVPPHLLDKWGKPEGGKGGEWCSLVDYDKDGENKILAAALYRFGNMSFAEAMKATQDESQQEKLAEALLGGDQEQDVDQAGKKAGLGKLLNLLSAKGGK